MPIFIFGWALISGPGSNPSFKKDSSELGARVNAEIVMGCRRVLACSKLQASWIRLEEYMQNHRRIEEKAQ